jgi:NAD(P)-dependent dehydrogenase (short-subunit alcohol dehydrogenase family)
MRDLAGMVAVVSGATRRRGVGRAVAHALAAADADIVVTGTVEEVAAMVCHLCGSHARWITGRVIMIDGGEVR